jgi:hypothetical protein
MSSCRVGVGSSRICSHRVGFYSGTMDSSRNHLCEKMGGFGSRNDGLRYQLSEPGVEPDWDKAKHEPKGRKLSMVATQGDNLD